MQYDVSFDCDVRAAAAAVISLLHILCISYVPHLMFPLCHWRSEDTIHNIAPSIDKQIAKRLAYIIASSKEFNSCTNESSEDITVRIKRICKKIIESVIAKRHNKGKMRRRKTKDSLDDSETAKTLLLLHRSPSNTSKKQLITTKDCRYNMLIHVVGVEMFNEIMSVSQEIRNIRQHSKLWSRFSPRCNVSRSTSSVSSLGDVVDDDYHCKMIEYEEKHDPGTKEEEERLLPASQALPLPIADIYFHTRLVNVMHIIDSGSCKQCIPIEELSTKEEQKRQQRNGCIVYQTNWQELLLDAKTKLEAFHTFQRKELLFI